MLDAYIGPDGRIHPGPIPKYEWPDGDVTDHPDCSPITESGELWQQ